MPITIRARPWPCAGYWAIPRRRQIWCGSTFSASRPRRPATSLGGTAMLTPDDLIETHRRTQQGTITLLDHCRQFSPEELQRELPGFGFPTVLLQFDHLIGAEDYWVRVLMRCGFEEQEF